MKKHERLTVKYNGWTVGTLSLTPDNALCTFEYDTHWLAEGFCISPIELPLRKGTFVAKPTPFAGGFGIFEDSMPDGYGRYLLHKALLREGINDYELTTLDRLSIVGSRGMGALSYAPENEFYDGNFNVDFDSLQAKALEVLKEHQSDDASMLLFNSGNSGGARPKAVFADEDGHWLVKFRHYYDPDNIGRIELRYNEIARRCGIDVPDFKLVKGKYFASRRFDINARNERVHVATAGGLLGVSLATPVLDYENLLALTGWLTQNAEDVKEMYRRMIFNYLTGNRDDHCKNFSFLVEGDTGSWKWRLAPAYDLTYCAEGYNGEHATSVNGTGRPTLNDFLTVGRNGHLNESICRSIIEEVRGECSDLLCYEL